MAKETRSIKVYRSSGYQYRETPTIMLKGQWLKELGFDIGDYISVSCENGKIIITRDVERAELEEAEKAFMERETAELQKRFAAEKKRLRQQFVAEKKTGFGI